MKIPCRLPSEVSQGMTILYYDTACAPLNEGGGGEKMPDPHVKREADKSVMTGRNKRVLQSFHILRRTSIAQEKRAAHRRPKKYYTDQTI